MRPDSIKRLPVGTIADRDCYLFLWATAPCLPEALEVLESWGFRYSTVAFTWIKLNRISGTLFWGMGNGTRANAEFVLLGRKGRLDRMAANVHSTLLSPIERHSKKPAEIRKRIVRLYGDLPRIELFARARADGWDAWGNEVDSDVVL